MAVAVYGQLERLLRERNLTVADLKRQIEEEYGLVVDAAVLDHLASPKVLQQTDLTVVGAAASALGVSLDDLLLVVTLPPSLIAPQTDPSFLDEGETRRVFELFDRQDEGLLTEEERSELEALVYDKYGRRSHDYFRRKEAQRRGVSLEQVQREEDERIAKAVAWLEWLDADPRRRKRLIERARPRQLAAP